MLKGLFSKTEPKRGPGRPPVKPEDRAKHKLIAVREHTHADIKRLSKQEKMKLIDWLEKIVEDQK